MQPVRPGKWSRTFRAALGAISLGLIIIAATPLPALAAKYPTNTGTVTGTAAGSAQIDVSADYTTGASCGGGGDAVPTFTVQWDVAPADWVGYGTSGALTDAGAVSPFNYSITTGLIPGQTYAIRVVYSDGDGVNVCLGASQTVNASDTVTLPNNGLTVGTNSAVVDSSTQITVTAAFTGDANGNSTTKVEYNTSDAWPGTAKCASISGASPRTCVVDGLQAGTQYWFRVTHTDSDGITGTNPQVIGPYTTTAGGKIFCGSCHGAVSKTPAYEAPGLPVGIDDCNNNVRGLHGTHNNYSSAAFMIGADGKRGNCAYCHTATTDKAPTAIHNNNYLNITGYNSGGVDSTGLRFNANTCTNACHRNRGETAAWGNYTSLSIVLSCRSCHDDVQDKTGLSGAHAAHLFSNITVNGGLMGAANNAGCLNCHPDNVNDLWSGGKADDGTKKAYPHASDGTIVLSDNAAVNAGLNITRVAGPGDSCANACHGNTTASWNGGVLACDACHYHNITGLPTAAANDAATVTLPGGHSTHFGTSAEGIACDNCHPAVSDLGHIGSLPVGSTVATVLASLNWNGSTCNDGACHLSLSPVWGTSGNGCATCHYYPGAPGRDWTATGNGHLARSDANESHMKATGFNYQLDQFADVVASTDKCGLCHRNTKHRNGSGFAHLSSAAGYQYCGPDNFTFSTGGVGNGSNPMKCSNVKCHSGRTTPDWWE